MHAIDFLKAPGDGGATGPIAVLYGPERFLKQAALKVVVSRALGEAGDELSLTRLAGEGLELKTVLDALLTVSMWGPRQVVLVEDADDFVSAFREGLERYLERPAKKSLLILDVQSWPSNTRLARASAKVGLPIECSELKAPAVVSWLTEQSRRQHGKKLDRPAAQLMVELAGTELGLLDQELAKLAAYVGESPSIDSAAVEKLVGGWKTETTWKLLDAVRDGHLGTALGYLDKLLDAGEHPLKLMGGINFVFRPIARGTELARQQPGEALSEALTLAGVKPFTVQPVCHYLRRIGRPRAERILSWLVEADAGLKGASPLPEGTIIERLLVRLAGKSP